MKSIRMSLVVYFLALLTVALGTASLLTYRSAQNYLEEKKKTTTELVIAQYQERCEKEKDRLNQELLHQAENLAELATLQVDRAKLSFPFTWDRVHRGRSMLPDPRPPLDPSLHMFCGILGNNLALGGFVPTSGWVAEINRQLSNPEKFVGIQPEAKFELGKLLEHAQNIDDRIAQYYQLDGFFLGATYRSESLGKRSLLIDPETFAPDQVVYHEFDDYRLDENTLVHRVKFKVSGARIVGLGGGPRGGGPPDGGRGSRGGGGPPPPDRGARGGGGGLPPGNRGPRPAIYIQCAFDVSKLERAFEEFAERRDEKLSALEADTEASLASLRKYLLGMIVAVFAATAIGGFWLVRLGLLPLRRLSHAVSRVSEKDLDFQFEERRLPVELRPIVDRLRETFDQLKRAFAREKKATADISHELRTPLAALLTTIELALRKPRSAEEYREFLQDCHLSGKQMNQAVDRLLTLARLDAGVEVVRPQEVDAAHLAEQCAAIVRPLAEARGLHLHVRREGETHVTTDPDKLREVLNNLLHNAIQYNKPDGSIDVSVTRVNGHLDLAVSDTGIGISSEAREHIFERFYRADPSRGTDGLHTGLGLSIVKEFVGLMGGTIAVESAEGKGSTFRVQLPVR